MFTCFGQSIDATVATLSASCDVCGIRLITKSYKLPGKRAPIGTYLEDVSSNYYVGTAHMTTNACGCLGVFELVVK